MRAPIWATAVEVRQSSIAVEGKKFFASFCRSSSFAAIVQCVVYGIGFFSLFSSILSKILTILGDFLNDVTVFEILKNLKQKGVTSS